MPAKKYIYKPEYIDLLPSLFENGEGMAEVAVALKVTRRTLYYWCEKYPEFDEAIRDAKETQCRAWWDGIARKLVTGTMKGNANVYIVNMRNRFGFRDVPTDKIEAIGTIQLNVVDKTSKDA